MVSLDILYRAFQEGKIYTMKYNWYILMMLPFNALIISPHVISSQSILRVALSALIG